MALKKRERLLAIITASLLVPLVGYLVVTALGTPRGLEQRHAQLIDEVSEQKKLLERAKPDEVRLKEWNRRALPSDVTKAQSLYHDWLVKTADGAGLVKPTIYVTQARQVATGRTNRLTRSAASRGGTAMAPAEAFTALQFRLQAQATLEQMTRFLHAFYSAGYLQRITSLKTEPREDANQLDISLTIEALSLPDAESADALPEPPEEPLLKAVTEYKQAIVDRNVFAFYHPPAAAPPQAVWEPGSQLYLSAVMAGDRPQAWLVKRQGNETLKLSEGDRIPLEGHPGTLTRIGQREVELEFDGKPWRFLLGNSRKPIEVTRSEPAPSAPAEKPEPPQKPSQEGGNVGASPSPAPSPQPEEAPSVPTVPDAAG